MSSNMSIAIGVLVMLVIIAAAVVIGLYVTDNLGEKTTSFLEKEYNKLLGDDDDDDDDNGSSGASEDKEDTGGTTDNKDPLPPAPTPPQPETPPDVGPPCDPSIVSSPCYVSPADYKARCLEKATEMGLDAKHSGFSGNFMNKGCYYYKKGSGSAYAGKAYFSAGTIEEMSGPLTHNTGATERIDITDFKKLAVNTDDKGDILQ